MRARYGEDGARFAAQLLAGRRPESFVEFPLCEEFVERSSATLVPSARARRAASHGLTHTSLPWQQVPARVHVSGCWSSAATMVVGMA